MSSINHLNAPTQFVEAAGVRFAYRRFGKSGGIPLVFNQHFGGTMDHWGSTVTNAIAGKREVILFDNAGDYLKQITQPTLVVNGTNDVIVYTVNSYTLVQNIPNAQLILYPDANHGSLYQYPDLFTNHVDLFLTA